MWTHTACTPSTSTMQWNPRAEPSPPSARLRRWRQPPPWRRLVVTHAGTPAPSPARLPHQRAP
eukprot:4911379-Prymnesium_polylepis.1